MTEPLPGILQEIADIIGTAGALQIASRYGGTRVYFPASSFIGKHWLVECVGQEAADKLCDHFAVDGRGQRIDIPLFGGTYRQLTRSIAERVHKLHVDDASSTEIARRLGITQRTVHRHRARYRGKKDDKQHKLL
jgi:Homeodomain-like domain